MRRAAEDRAIRAILSHARRLLRHAARPRRAVERAWPEEGDLDLDRTLEHLVAPPRSFLAHDLRLVRSEAREVDVVAILDLSLSMGGEKLALLAVATAILRLKLEHVAVVGFDSGAHVLVRVGERVSPRELVRRVLDVPAQGHTNIEAGLVAAADELRRGTHREHVGVLLTDGLANVGRDPLLVAGRFPRLHVVQLGGHHPQGSRTCRALAERGRGRVYRARSWLDLPEVTRRAVRELFRS